MSEVKLKKASNFATVASYPSNIKIYGQDKDEFIFLFLRESRVSLFFNFLLVLFLALIVFFIPFILNIVQKNLFDIGINFEEFIGSKFWVAFIFIWMSYTVSQFFNITLRWFYNINILTNKRFLDLDVVSLFQNNVDETNLFNIQDVKENQTNIIQSIFHMGEIEVVTASGSESTSYNLKNVYMPEKVRDFISDVVIKYKESVKNEN